MDLFNKTQIAALELDNAALRNKVDSLDGQVRSLEDEKSVLGAQVGTLEEQVGRLSRYGAMSAVEVEAEVATLSRLVDAKKAEISDLAERATTARSLLVEKEDLVILQEVGIYQFSEVLDSAVDYEVRVKEINAEINAANKPNGTAVTAASGWTVNGSAAAGAHMVLETSKLMLRAYNGEVEDAIRTLKPYKSAAALDRLNKVRDTIAKLGLTMRIEISASYHALRISELKLNADFLQKQAEEKEAQKEMARKLKDEAKAQAEFEAEKSKYLKDLAHNETILRKAEGTGNEKAMDGAKSRIEEINLAITGVEERAANIKQGYVYVISNIGSFGEGVVKIGLTRRLNYEDRIHELSDASIPFIFDIHAVIASTDAVALEKRLHAELEPFRLNKVNTRKEFFRVNPSMVMDKLEQIAGENLLLFIEEAEAPEFRVSTGRLSTREDGL